MHYLENIVSEKEAGLTGRGVEIRLQAGSKYDCYHCGLELETIPERSEGDWFIQCLSCGAKNIVIPVLPVIGWRI